MVRVPSVQEGKDQFGDGVFSCTAVRPEAAAVFVSIQPVHNTSNSTFEIEPRGS